MHPRAALNEQHVDPSPVFRVHAMMLLPGFPDKVTIHNNKRVIGLISRQRHTCFHLHIVFQVGSSSLSGGRRRRRVVESFPHARTLRTLTNERRSE